MPTKDKEKQLAYQRKHYANNKDYYYQRNIRRRHMLRQWMREYKSGLVCARCGQDHPATLHFHHLDPANKEYSISQMLSRHWGLDKIKAEIAKCIVLCANCHSIEHWSD